MTAFTSEDLQQFALRGIAADEARAQIAALRDPPPPARLDRPCTVGDGIRRLDDREISRLAASGQQAAAAGRVTKFVPASGAATRMFKELIAAAASERPSSIAFAREFFEKLDSFAFAEELRTIAGVKGRPQTDEEERAILRAMLETMDYARKPKGLIAFHRVSSVRTAFEEHLLEGTRFARGADGAVRMHFTVAPEFRPEFESALADHRPAIEQGRAARLEVGFSEQHPATDTLAIDSEGNPFRTNDGALLFRPGGHGSLLRNLEETQADIAVIKNIDNILPDEANAEVVQWKEVLTGLLADVQAQVFAALAACETRDEALDDALALAASLFDRRPAAPLRSADEKRRFVREALDRPIRVCGVVRNEGEPGGAPFWVVEPDGARSIQIVESAQVDTSDPGQAKIFAASTHFNPVDIVCGLRSWRGEPFDLNRFVDPDAVFLSQKSHEGRTLTALERPGLWNGSMARWNTLCVEVPGSTFAPVKTVMDLLREQHQAKG